jgi:hypothetical protein
MTNTVEIRKDTLEKLYCNVDISTIRQRGGQDALNEVQAILKTSEVEGVSLSFDD